MEKILRIIKKIVPTKLFKLAQPFYHFSLSLAGATIYRFPSRKLKIIAITGTKGKTSTVEIINAILEQAGYKTAIFSTLRFKIGERSWDNKFKMTMPGRFFLQRNLRKAVKEKCDYAIIEMTSEGTKQFRHKFINIDTLIFTNLAKEHIESHGSFENYLKAKLKIAKALEKSKKEKLTIIVNADDKYADRFLNINVDKKISYSLQDARPYEIKMDGIEFTRHGQKTHSNLSGVFNLSNILASVSLAENEGVNYEIIKRALDKFSGIAGRMEKIILEKNNPNKDKQDFTVIVDYAHTPDSLNKVYEFFQGSKKICVLGNTGGGRDKWKRPEMGSIASKHCSHIILTDEDPYDEDPREIVKDVAEGISRPIYEIVMERRKAINKALKMAKTGDSVIITGKGTDPYIMGKNGKKTPWSDSRVTREELQKILKNA